MKGRIGGEMMVGGGSFGKGLAVCAKRCMVSAVRVFNKGAARVYIQIHDTAGVAPSGSDAAARMSTCKGMVYADADSYGGEQFGDNGIILKNGCYIFMSSAANDATAIAGDDCLITANVSQVRS